MIYNYCKMDYCPVCTKNGIKRKIIAFQINLEEAVWACEEKECIWPFGYCELTFFKRTALYNELEDRSLIKENISVSMELSLYTPPMTPLGQSSESTVSPPTEDKSGETLPKNESIDLRRNSVASHMSPSLELQKVETNNSIEEDRNVTKETNAYVGICRTLPKIIDVQESNIDIALTCQGTDKDFDNQKIEDCKHMLANASPVIDIAKEITVPFEDTLWEKLNMGMQSEMGDKQSESNNMQSNGANDSETNCIKVDILSATIKSQADADNVNNISTVNNSALDISDSDINLDMILDVLSKEDCITQNMNNDWLDLLQI